MHRSIWRRLKLGIMTGSILALLLSWHTISQANPGEPILLVVNDSYAGNKFGPYLGEILRAEGLNAFEVIQLSSLTASDLNNHDLTILAETSLSPTQVTLLTTYVNGGGRLLAMRPSTLIKDLFGLGTPAGVALTDGYLKIDTSATLNGSIPGQGLTNATLQIHGNADRYSPAAGAVILAQLYNDATTPTSYPAAISSSSGRAVAFTYDLAWNVVYTRQGNPANADVDANGDPDVFRTIELFQETITQPIWIDRDKIPIPQADEQQRLFARLVKQLVAEARPLPQLWYFPNTAKTMLILTGDAHAQSTSVFTNEINSIDAHGGKITLYLSIASDPQNSQAGDNNDVQDWRAQGHEFGIHPYHYKEDSYPPFDIDDLVDGYDTYTTWFASTFSSPASRTVRNHRLAWLGWTDAADIAASRGYRLDTNFYHWGGWVQKPDNTWPHGYITGSGQPMKFIRDDGVILPLYQQLTQLVDEHLLAGVPGSFEGLTGSQAITVSRQLIDASQAGDYAALMTQFHLDYYDFGAPQVWAEGTLDYANSLGVPIWNADQWLSFTETRHDANYSDINWNDTTKTLTFNLSAAATTGISLTTILPLTYRGHSLQSVTVDSLPASYTIQTIKGVDVAFVSVQAGNHSFVAQYQNDVSEPPGQKVFLPVVLK